MLFAYIYAVAGIIFSLYTISVLWKYGDIQDMALECGIPLTAMKLLLFAVEMAVFWPVTLILGLFYDE